MYFINFSTFRFIPELNSKLEIEGRAPISAFSTRKSRIAKNASTGNVASSLSPPTRNGLNQGNLQQKNPLHQTRGNLNQIEDEPVSLTNLAQIDNNKTSRIQMQSSNMINFQNSANSLHGQNNAPQLTPQESTQNTYKYEGPRTQPSLFSLDKLPKDKTFVLSNNTRKPSFSMNPEPSLANSGDNSKIPVLLSRKYSDDSLIGAISSSSSPQNPTSKSTPNIVEETSPHNFSTTTSATTNPTSSLQAKEKRFSIQISTPLLFHNQSFQQPPPPAPKKYSFSFPPPGGTSGESSINSKMDERKTPETSPVKQQSNQLPVTTLTFSMNSSGLSFSQSLVKPPSNVTSGTNSNGTTVNQTFSTYQKRSSPTTLTKPKAAFSVNNSSYFPQPIGYGASNQNTTAPYSTQNTFTYQNSLGNSKSLPVTIFGSSMLRNNNHTNGNLSSVTESFLPRMTGKNIAGNQSNDENVGSLLSNGKKDVEYNCFRKSSLYGKL